MINTDTWIVVLAGGDGLRLHGLTVDATGQSVPKQFCSVDGSASLLELAVRRAQRLVPSERILVSVTDEHRTWWREDLSLLPSRNVVREPTSRGTLPGVLLPLLEAFAREPTSRVVVLPSDHLVLDEISFERAIRSALDDVEQYPERVVLLGMRPEMGDPDFGWIVPEPTSGGNPRPVSRFREKPGRPEAGRLCRAGALVNSFVLAARVWTLVDLCERLEPDLYWSLRVARWSTPGAQGNLFDAYRQLPAGDFSRDILERAPGSLLVRSVPACGWCDLGTPARLARWIGERRFPVRAVHGGGGSRPVLSGTVFEPAESRRLL